ncbi:antibiotic biosynthesis monooxygenase family protein [Hephaestia sp. GCM10023244]|uniref:antibiotic biosynthesis monooxygenase family protein n=1 Tax=unclassified Hephaestia TaxID=2631281 RepID=UPI002076DB2F|nr:antibiotic biosynthesis monooxygenase [Hephaestia sp. MAHUQ-44]MCM8731301.1 antibiotic biosynthesis monooxygenase [Hephaestia sp. MAHUQ-44]
MDDRAGQIAVIFVSQRTPADADGYDRAAQAMAALAARQPGYCGIDSARGPDGRGITVSYWADEASALAWRDHPEHVPIRNQGRAHWYRDYQVFVTQVTRGYAWSRG